MKPEQTIDSLKVYQQGNQYMLLTIGANGVNVVSTPIPPIAKNTIESLQDTITQLKEQNAKLEKDNESYASVAKLLARSQDSVDELEAQNANYKEQITALVKEKHRRERREE